jgi:glycine dehydrogenase subunit 2
VHRSGGGPAVGAYGCTAALAPYLPAPVVRKEGDAYRLDQGDERRSTKVREFWGTCRKC